MKFCLVAAGEADLYPRLSPTCEWDTGAGHAVLSAAGGKVLALDASPLLYGKPNFFNPGFLAAGPLDPIAATPFIGPVSPQAGLDASRCAGSGVTYQRSQGQAG